MKTILLVAGSFMLAAVALGGTQDQARLALHYTATCDKCIPDYCGVYSPNTSNTPCSEYNTLWFAQGGTGAVAYLVLAHADSAAGVQSVEFGIAYDPQFPTYFWSTCGDQEFPHDSPRGEPWPFSGSGNLVEWNPAGNCQRTTVQGEGVHAVVGVFALYAYDIGDYTFHVTGDSSLVEPAILVEDCQGGQSVVAGPGGSIGVQSPGVNPCTQPMPVARTTWGRIKTAYGVSPPSTGQ